MDDTQPPTHAGSAPSRSRRVLFTLGALLAGLAPLMLIEAGLRIFDLGRPAAEADPLAGFNRNIPLFEREGSVYRTARARAPLVASQEFPVDKPRGSFRAFCFGGSTTYGHPYLADTAYPKWLELELAGSDPARSWQVINCGGVSYASYRIAPLVREVLHYQPDLIILESGHNEFLEDRTYESLKSRSAVWAWLQDKVYSLRLVGVTRHWLGHGKVAANRRDTSSERDTDFGPIVKTRLDSASGYASYRRDEAWRDRVVAQFDESVRAIITSCQAARVPVILIRLGSNLRDCPPFKSEHRSGLAPEPEADWQTAFDLATAAEPFDLGRALRYYEEASAIDGVHALLNYRIGRTLDRMNRPTEALRFYERAKDEDVCPLRIITPLDQTLSRLSVATGTPLVNAASLLAATSADHIPGFDAYVDHVHPTIGGHQRIARGLAAQMRTSGLLAKSAVWPDDIRVSIYQKHLEELGPAYFSDGERRVGWLERWAQRQRLAEEAAPNDALSYARLGFRYLDLGKEDDAWEALREALRRNPRVSSLIQAHAQELVSQGQPDRAAALLRQLN